MTGHHESPPVPRTSPDPWLRQDDRQHVVHVIHALHTGGLENGVINLITQMPEYRHTLACVTQVGAWRDRLPAGVEVIALGKRDRPSPDLPLRLAWLFRRLRPDIVHSRNWAAFDAVPGAWLARVPALVHGEHGREALDPSGANRRRNRFRRLLHPCVDRFATVTRDLARWLVDVVGIPARKVLTIQNGVDTTRFTADGREVARRLMGLDENAIVIGSVGRLDPVKDYPSLIEAFARLAPDHPESTLLLAGDGPERDALTALVAKTGLGERIRLVGERGDVPALLGALDLFVLPSIAEGMSNVILEAMASGVPVVATAVGGNAELVQDGITGRLVPARVPARLAAAIGTYLAEPHLRRLHGKAARERALADFSLERMVGSYRALYRSLLEEAGR
jgi:sugar transferase (PEP-CTERM/EpsH1 system associated)